MDEGSQMNIVSESAEEDSESNINEKRKTGQNEGREMQVGLH